MLRNKVVKEWEGLKELLACCKKMAEAEKELNKQIPKLEDKINDLKVKENNLRQKKQELTDKLLTYQECFVIAVIKPQPSKGILSHSNHYHSYPGWHNNEKILLSSKLPKSFAREKDISVNLVKQTLISAQEVNEKQLTLYFNH